MKKILSIALVSLLACGALLAGCGGEKKADPKAAGDKTKVAFVYVSSAKDGGYSMAHELGRQYVEKNMPNVQASYIESVPEGADSERVITQLASQGNKVIFTTSFGYMDPTINVAKKYPDITFLHCSGFKTAPNVGNYFGRMYEARYVTGIVAGKETKSNVIGYVAAFPIPEVIRGINAFTLGAQSVNPDVQVKVLWTNTWYNPATEKQAAITLIDAGADIIGVHVEATPHIHRALQMIKNKGVKAEVVINPGTPVLAIEPVLDMVDQVLVMTVNPGFGGQKFLPSTLEKIAQLRAVRDELGYDFDIQVDGGINDETVVAAYEAGANVFVAGSYVYDKVDPAAKIARLKALTK